jgi:hypothetical protein
MHYVINHIIVKLKKSNFLIRQLLKIDVKKLNIKYLGMERVRDNP